MIRAIHAQLTATGQRVPGDADRDWRAWSSTRSRSATPRVVAAIERLTGAPIAGIHVVGGGSRNAYLNQATADATGKPVLAGPVEATAAGNVIVQAVAVRRACLDRRRPRRAVAAGSSPCAATTRADATIWRRG